MKIRAFLTVLLMAIPAVAQSQDTTAIKRYTDRIHKDVRDTIDKDRGRPGYTKRAQDRTMINLDSILTAMRKSNTPPVPPSPTPSRIEIHSTATTVATGGTLQLSATVRDSANNVLPNAVVGWSSLQPAVADVSGTGLMTGKAAGTANILARSGSASQTRGYTVTGTSPPDTVTKPDTTKPDTSSTVGFDAVAELPRATVDVTLPIGFTVINVPAQPGALQAAIDAAGCRAELRLAPGFSYSPITLRVKQCNEREHTIIRTGNGLPDLASGIRMTPSLSVQRNHAKIVTTGGNIPAVTANAGVRGYYFIDLAIRATAGQVNGLVTLGTQQTTLAEVPGNFVFRQVYTGGGPTVDLKRCWYLNSFSTSIVDSWSDECHSNNGDSQWVLGLNGPGPYYIVNNYGECGHECVMFGGGDPSIQGLIPSDITLIGNHITRPSSWKGVWQVKNLIECKNARRMLIEGNVIENNWADGQVGYAILCKSVNQDGTAGWSQSRDITVRYNLIRNTGAGINLCGVCQAPAVASVNYSIHDNLIIGVNVLIYTGEAREWQFLGQLSNLSILHNTVINTAGVQTAISFEGQPPKITKMNFSCEAYDSGLYGVHGGSGGSDWRLWVDEATSKWVDNLGYTNGYAAAGFDSRGYYTGTVVCADGKPLGADAAKVYAMTAKSIVSDPLRGAGRQQVATSRQSGYRTTSQAQREANTKNGPSVR